MVSDTQKAAVTLSIREPGVVMSIKFPIGTANRQSFRETLVRHDVLEPSQYYSVNKEIVHIGVKDMDDAISRVLCAVKAVAEHLEMDVERLTVLSYIQDDLFFGTFNQFRLRIGQLIVARGTAR